MADDVTITVHVRDLTGPGFQSVSRNLNQLQRQANQMGGQLRIVGGQLDDVASSAANAGQNLGGGMGLRGQAIAAGAALGATLLPTIGALAPMLSGLAVVGGGAALAMDDLKKKAKELKKPFEEWQKVANKAVAPHTEKAVKNLKSAMKDLTPVIELGADTFGRITEKAAKFVDSPAFQSAFAKNAQMGAKWVEEFAGSVGTFTQKFLEFGTKSQPALDAWDNLLGGFLDTGMPGMFDEMERGVGGSSDVLNGLASLINDSLLPTLGKVAGSFAEAFGPLLKELLIGAGHGIKLFGELFAGAMKTLEPAAKIAADVFRGLNEIFKIGASVAGDLTMALGGALLGTMSEFAGQGGKVDGLRGSFSRFSDWVKENQATIRLAFTAMGMAMIDMVNLGIQSVPLLIGAFRGLTEMVLGSVELIIDGLASAFGDVPVVGDMFKDAQSQFDKYVGGFREKLAGMEESATRFADVAGDKLGRAKVVLNVEQAEASLEYIKQQLKDPTLTQERKAQLKVDKEQAEAALADAKRRLKDFDGKTATGKIKGNPSEFLGAVAKANGARVKDKTAKVKANTSFFSRAVATINGSVVGNAFINVHYSYKGGRRSDGATFLGPSGRYEADGGILSFYANGGMRENHVAQIAPAGSWRVWGEPETGGEAYIPLAMSKRGRSRKVAEEAVDRLGGDVQWFARGGVTKSEREARNAARGDLTLSHFGVKAGYKDSEIIGQLARADTLGSLVTSLNQWRSTIMKGTHGGQERGLLRALDSSGRKLLGWEKQLTAVTKSLESAKSKLNDLKSAASQLTDSVKSGILSGANITRAAGAENSRVTINTILSQMQGNAANASEFDRALKTLKTRGLSGALLQQVAEAGIEGGGLETAQALLGASSGQLKGLNSLQSRITGAAGSAGKTTSDAVFGAQIKAQQAYVTTLTRSQDRLQKSMVSLAKSIERMIERAFGKAAGGIVGGAAAGGVRSARTWVGEHGPELLDLPAGSRVWSNPDSRRMQAQAWASMLNEPQRTAGRPAVVAGSAGVDRPIVLNVHLGDKEFGQIWVDVGRKQVATRGGVRATLGSL